MWQELHGGNRQTVGRETRGTQTKLGSRLNGKSTLGQHSFEQNHRVLWEERKILETEKNSVCTKYKEA
jgi:hypothetical protein